MKGLIFRIGKEAEVARRRFLVGLSILLSLGIVGRVAGAPGPRVEEGDGATIVYLTQTPCQFVEVEGVPHEFVSRSSEDCERINKETAPQRVLRTLELKPGRTIFRVTNKTVPYPLGFYLRGKGLKGYLLPSTAGGGLDTGVTKDYEVVLKPGEYLYSCPLNPTPDYPLVVR